jgi:hypothetical protein
MVMVGDDEMASGEAEGEETQMTEGGDLDQMVELREGKHDCKTGMVGAGEGGKMLVGAR